MKWLRNSKSFLAMLALNWCAACGGRSLATRHSQLPIAAREIGSTAIPQLERAWVMSHAGTAAVEEAVVVTRTAVGGYEAAVQPHSNLHGSARFALPANAVALFHTHSDRVLPQPSRSDRRLADRIGVPVLTMTREGLFLYDPASKLTSKLMGRLDWLKAECWLELADRGSGSVAKTHTKRGRNASARARRCE